LAINVLGFAETVPTKVLKTKIARCADRLLREQVIRLPQDAASVRHLFAKPAKGRHEVRFLRGPYFDRRHERSCQRNHQESPLYEPLRQIGFDAATSVRIIGQFKPKLIQEWTDITLAAIERGIIKKSPPSYFMHYIQEAEARRTTPPDWWRELRRQEQEQEREERRAASRKTADESFEQYLQVEAREAFERVMDRLFRGLRDAGQSESEARENAEYAARVQIHRQFLREHPRADDGRMTRLADLL
jgi:hypothetical protein